DRDRVRRPLEIRGPPRRRVSQALYSTLRYHAVRKCLRCDKRCCDLVLVSAIALPVAECFVLLLKAPLCCTRNKLPEPVVRIMSQLPDSQACYLSAFRSLSFADGQPVR